MLNGFLAIAWLLFLGIVAIVAGVALTSGLG
jgi:hypothetical protein